MSRLQKLILVLGLILTILGARGIWKAEQDRNWRPSDPYWVYQRRRARRRSR